MLWPRRERRDDPHWSHRPQRSSPLGSTGVDVEITPEPTPEERAAIVAALTQVQVDDARGPGPWWEAGLRESVGDDEE